MARRCEFLNLKWRADLGATRGLRRLLPTLLAVLPSLSPERTVRIAVAVVHMIDAIGPIGLRHAFVRAAVAAQPNDARAQALSAMLPESAEAGARVAAALAHPDPEVRFLGLDVRVSLRMGDISPTLFQGLMDSTDDPYPHLQMERWSCGG